MSRAKARILSTDGTTPMSIIITRHLKDGDEETRLQLGTRLRDRRDAGRTLIITGFTTDGQEIHVRRNTSRRTQGIRSTRILGDYEVI
jgi:hypothetical protein